MVSQGEIYWADFGDADDHEAAFLRPAVVVQNNAVSDAELTTVVVCPCTGTLRKARWPGNVHLNEGEGGLPKESVVEVVLITALDRQYLHGLIGKLSNARVHAIIAGIHELIDPLSNS